MKSIFKRLAIVFSVALAWAISSFIFHIVTHSQSVTEILVMGLFVGMVGLGVLIVVFSFIMWVWLG